MQKKLVVVADDFTGANDTGVQFKKAGLKVKVIINASALSKEIEQCDVVVIDLESRLLSQKEAYERSFKVGKQLLNIENCIVYKKLDSTFRGNIGAEMDGLMDAMHLKIVLLAAALPVYGRTTENGEVYVNKVKLAETEVSNDPHTPVRHSRIADIVGIQSKRVCREIATDLFKEDFGTRNDFIVKEINNGSEIFIFDSRSENDLERIAGLIESIDYVPFLLAGSAGLASQLSKSSLFLKRRLSFVFAGSISEKTRAQITHSLNHDNCKLIFLEGEKLLAGNCNAAEICTAVTHSIEKGIGRFMFTSALTPEHVQKVYQLAQQKNLSQDEAAGKLSFEMGSLAATLIKRFSPSLVLLTGGETAINTVRALGATGIEIEQEILPGVQSGSLTGCSVRSVIVTKAGGFGEVDAISKTFQFFNI